MVSCLTFRSLIHFEFIFVYGVRECSHYISLPVAVQLSQHHLLKRLSFLHHEEVSSSKSLQIVNAGEGVEEREPFTLLMGM